jgi:peptidoglycan/xylan/chitin deacetylase (PgdA/CDA1 family)
MSAKPNFRRHVKGALIASRVVQLAARVVPQQIAILKYHSVQDEPERYVHSLGGGIVTSTGTFRKQMEIVARKFHPVTMDDVLLFLDGKKQLPRKPVVITFDDGFADNIEIAAPILEHFGIRGAFYITVDPVEKGGVPWFCRIRHAFGTTRRQTWSDSVDGSSRNLADPANRKAAFLVASERCARRRGDAQEIAVRTIEEELEVQPLAEKLMMTWDQVRTLYRLGHIIGSHTVTHPNMACMGAEDLRIECVESKNKLEKELGAAVPHFSYPSPILQPHWSKETRQCTEEAGYRCAVTSTAGPAQKSQHPLALQRVVVPEDTHEFVWILENTMLSRRFP